MAGIWLLPHMIRADQHFSKGTALAHDITQRLCHTATLNHRDGTSTTVPNSMLVVTSKGETCDDS